MKTLLVCTLIALATVSGNITNAQSKTTVTGGLYITSQDFGQQKLTYEINCGNGKDKIKADEFFGSPTGYVISGGEKHIFEKSKVYGYRTCQNKTYRFYNGKAYLLVDTSGFFIYYQYMPEEIEKGKELVKRDEYFFSKTTDSDLEPLTVDNLKAAYNKNAKFYYSLDANFRSDKDLVVYDRLQKQYRIQYFYNQSVK